MSYLTITHLDEGFNMAVDSDCPLVGRAIALTHTWNPVITNLVKGILKPGQTAVDIGANMGYYSLLFDKIVGPLGKVYAVEPVEKNITFLEFNRILNQANYEIFGCGVSDTMETIFLEISGTVGFPSQWLKQDGKVPNLWEFMTRTVPIFAVPIDALLAKCTAVDLIKMDVEGYEIKTLSGAQQTLSKFLPTIICEINPEWLNIVSKSGANTIYDFILAFEAYHIWIIHKDHVTPCGRDVGLIESTINAILSSGCNAMDLLVTTEERIAQTR